MLFTLVSGISCSKADILNTFWHWLAISKKHSTNFRSVHFASYLLPSLPFQGENSSCSYLQIPLDGNKLHMMSWEIPWGAAELQKRNASLTRPAAVWTVAKAVNLHIRGYGGPCAHRVTPLLSPAVRKIVPTAPNEVTSVFAGGRKAEGPASVGFSVCWLKAIGYILYSKQNMHISMHCPVLCLETVFLHCGCEWH